MKKSGVRFRIWLLIAGIAVAVGLAVSNGTTPSSAVHAAQSSTSYVTVSKRNYKIWNNLKWQQSVLSTPYLNDTFAVQGQPVSANGMQYYRLQKNDGSFLGYINQFGIRQAKGAQGVGFGTDRYVTISKPNVNIYGSFNWNKVNSTNAIFQKTFHARVLYHHFNGMDYYSLYDQHNKWSGYLNANAVRVSGSSMGQMIAQNRYVTVTSKDYYLYRDASYHRAGWSSSLYHHAFRVNGQYNAFNGATYLSLVDGNGRSKGILNTSAVKAAPGAQGIPFGSNQQVRVQNAKAVVWRNFNWTQRASLSTYQGKTLTAKVHYNHLNGATYYSLYNGNTWIGYVNGGFLKAPQPATPQWLRSSETKAYPTMQSGNYLQVSIARQRVYVKNKKGQVLYTMICSTGMNNTTPRGTFYIQAERGYSFYNASLGEGAHYWTSFLEHGVYLFHSVPTNRSGQYVTSEAKKLGRPASHGCVRLPVPDARWINTHVKIGTRVIIG